MNKFEQHQQLKKTEGEWEKIFEEQKKSPSSPKEVVLERNEISARQFLGGGVNRTEFVKIKDDGDGVFKPKEGEVGGVIESGTGYRRERAAYLVDLFLGFNIIPPTIIRTIQGEEGSLQEFVPDAEAAASFDFGGMDADGFEKFNKYRDAMELFDVLVTNEDRHDGNYLINKDGRLWGIDHGCTFRDLASAPYHIPPVLRAPGIDSFDEGAVEKIKTLADSPDKTELLRKLLLELLKEDEVELFFEKLKIVAQSIKNNQIDGNAALEINNKLYKLYKIL